MTSILTPSVIPASQQRQQQQQQQQQQQKDEKVVEQKQDEKTKDNLPTSVSVTVKRVESSNAIAGMKKQAIRGSMNLPLNPNPGNTTKLGGGGGGSSTAAPPGKNSKSGGGGRGPGGKGNGARGPGGDAILGGPGGGESSRKKSPRDFTKPPTLPPLDLGVSIGGVGLDKTVRRMELQLRGLEIQFERFKRAHEELKNDYEDLETYCEELEEAFVSPGKGAVLGLDEKENVKVDGEGGGEDEGGEGQPNSRARFSPTRPGRPTYRRVRSAPRTRARSPTAGSPSNASPLKRRASSHPSRGVWGQIHHHSSQRSPNGNNYSPRRGSNSIRRSRSSGRSVGGRDGSSNSRPSSSGHGSTGSGQRGPLKPRMLPKRMRSVAIPSDDLETIQYSELGSTYAAFPKWSKLGDLGALDTFKMATGPSAVKRWKNGKPPA